MILSLVEMTDFRSIKGTIKLDCDRKVTILLGSNDHGKTNILRAVEHLNDDAPITEEEANWDADGSATISFSFALTPTEKKEWKALIEAVANRKNAILQQKVEEEAATNASESAEENGEAVPKTTTSSKIAKKPTPSEDDALEAELLVPESVLDPLLATIVLTRKGVGGALQFGGLEMKV